MSKKIESKLDRYTEQLVAMEAEVPTKTLSQMQAWLLEEGVRVDQSTIGRFLESQRSLRSQARIMELVTTGSSRCQEIDKAFARNPAPQLESLIKLFKTLIFDLTTKGALQPEMLNLANNLTVTVCGYLSGQTKAAHKERELTIEETKFAESRKNEQTKALELCLDEANRQAAGGNSLAKELFQKAFAALKSGKSK